MSPIPDIPTSPTPAGDADAITDRLNMGRAIFTAKEVKTVCQYYISTSESGARPSMQTVKFVKSACFPFASPQAKQQLRSLSNSNDQSTVERYVNILIDDGAPLRLQNHYEAHPDTLFFVGEVLQGSQDIAQHESNQWHQIPHAFIQSALAILSLHESGQTLFDPQDIQVLYSYLENLIGRGADIWLNLAVFFRDTAHPFVSSRLRTKYGSFSATDEIAVIAEQYTDLLSDGSITRLVETISHPPHVKVEVKPEVVQHREPGIGDPSASKADTGESEQMQEQLKKNVKPPHSPHKPKYTGAPDPSKIPRSGTVDPAGHALPSFLRRRQTRSQGSVYSNLSPRQIRDIVRQYDAKTQRDIHNNPEVFYWSSPFAVHIRPEYFWVLDQELENDEMPLTESQITALFPLWRTVMGLPPVQENSISPIPNSRSKSPREIEHPSAGSTPTLYSVSTKADHLTYRVEDLFIANDELRSRVDKLTGQIKDLEALCSENQKKSDEDSNAEEQIVPNKPAFPSGKKRQLPLEGESSGGSSVQPISQRLRRPNRRNVRRSARRVAKK